VSFGSRAEVIRSRDRTRPFGELSNFFRLPVSAPRPCRYGHLNNSKSPPFRTTLFISLVAPLRPVVPAVHFAGAYHHSFSTQVPLSRCLACRFCNTNKSSPEAHRDIARYCATATPRWISFLSSSIPLYSIPYMLPCFLPRRPHSPPMPLLRHSIPRWHTTPGNMRRRLNTYLSSQDQLPI
jgi:hypothetical protein